MCPRSQHGGLVLTGCGKSVCPWYPFQSGPFWVIPSDPQVFLLYSPWNNKTRSPFSPKPRFGSAPHNLWMLIDGAVIPYLFRTSLESSSPHSPDVVQKRTFPFHQKDSTFGDMATSLLCFLASDLCMPLFLLCPSLTPFAGCFHTEGSLFWIYLLVDTLVGISLMWCPVS